MREHRPFYPPQYFLYKLMISHISPPRLICTKNKIWDLIFSQEKVSLKLASLPFQAQFSSQFVVIEPQKWRINGFLLCSEALLEFISQVVRYFHDLDSHDYSLCLLILSLQTWWLMFILWDWSIRSFDFELHRVSWTSDFLIQDDF